MDREKHPDQCDILRRVLALDGIEQLLLCHVFHLFGNSLLRNSSNHHLPLKAKACHQGPEHRAVLHVPFHLHVDHLQSPLLLRHMGKLQLD